MQKLTPENEIVKNNLGEWAYIIALSYMVLTDSVSDEMKATIAKFVPAIENQQWFKDLEKAEEYSQEENGDARAKLLIEALGGIHVLRHIFGD